MRGSINLVISVNTNLIVVVGITGTNVWRDNLKQYLRNIFFCFYHPNKVDALEVNHIKNTDGRQLAFNLDQEAEIYFKQLEAAWSK